MSVICKACLKKCYEYLFFDVSFRRKDRFFVFFVRFSHISAENEKKCAKLFTFFAFPRGKNEKSVQNCPFLLSTVAQPLFFLLTTYFFKQGAFNLHLNFLPKKSPFFDPPIFQEKPSLNQTCEM